MEVTCTHLKQVAGERCWGRGGEEGRAAQARQDLIGSKGPPSGGGEAWVQIHQVSQLGWSLESIQNGLFQIVGHDPLGE